MAPLLNVRPAGEAGQPVRRKRGREQAKPLLQPRERGRHVLAQLLALDVAGGGQLLGHRLGRQSFFAAGAQQQRH